jgi:hypothetical protein
VKRVSMGFPACHLLSLWWNLHWCSMKKPPLFHYLHRICKLNYLLSRDHSNGIACSFESGPLLVLRMALGPRCLSPPIGSVFVVFFCFLFVVVACFGVARPFPCCCGWLFLVLVLFGAFPFVLSFFTPLELLVKMDA